MVGNNGMVRALNLDLCEIPVTIGGRDFLLKMQAKRPLMRVLDAIFKSDDELKVAAAETDEPTDEVAAAAENKEPADEAVEVPLSENIAEMFMKEWDKSLPTFAMMFSFDPKKEDTFKEAVDHLEENLAPMAGVRVFKQWWLLNEIDAFFIRCGRTLIHPEMEREIEAEVHRRVQSAAQEIVDTAMVAEAVSE